MDNSDFASMGHLETLRGYAGESRTHKFPIRQSICYRYRKSNGLSEAAAGETTYISSREVEFTTEHVLPVGQKIEVALDWPVLLDDTCPMKLIIRGHVIRNDAETAAVSIERYEFHTRAVLARPSAAP